MLSCSAVTWKCLNGMDDFGKDGLQFKVKKEIWPLIIDMQLDGYYTELCLCISLLSGSPLIKKYYKENSPISKSSVRRLVPSKVCCL